MDMLGKAMDFAKNYAACTFPRTSLVLGTLMKVMKMDMYVITPIEDDHFFDAQCRWHHRAVRPFLGDGELSVFDWIGSRQKWFVSRRRQYDTYC